MSRNRSSIRTAQCTCARGGKLSLLGALCGGLFGLLSCSGGHEPGSLGGDTVLPRPSSSADDGGRAGGCDPWSVRECGVELGIHDGVVNCARGIQVCEGGQWGSCLVDPSKGTASVKAPEPAAGHYGID